MSENFDLLGDRPAGPGDWITESPDLHPVDHPASRFLGKEFLLWLWWRSEQDYASIDLDALGTVDFWLGDRIQFRTEGDDPQISDFKGGAPATTAEAKMAVRVGKIVETASLVLKIKERQYDLQLKGEGLEIVGLRVPSECDEGVDEQIFERMFLLEEATAILDQLFYRFCEMRLGKGWNTHVLPDMRAWVAEDS